MITKLIQNGKAKFVLKIKVDQKMNPKNKDGLQIGPKWALNVDFRWTKNRLTQFVRLILMHIFETPAPSSPKRGLLSCKNPLGGFSLIVWDLIYERCGQLPEMHILCSIDFFYSVTFDPNHWAMCKCHNSRCEKPLFKIRHPVSLYAKVILTLKGQMSPLT